MELFGKFVDKELLARLDFVLERPFQRITYSNAVELLKKSGEKFEFPIDYGLNLQSEHERWLTEKHFKCPVTVFNFPKEIKPFYMRSNDDGKTVAAMDLLVPGIGEIVGGSQREERLRSWRTTCGVTTWIPAITNGISICVATARSRIPASALGSNGC